MQRGADLVAAARLESVALRAPRLEEVRTLLGITCATVMLASCLYRKSPVRGPGGPLRRSHSAVQHVRPTYLAQDLGGFLGQNDAKVAARERRRSTVTAEEATCFSWHWASLGVAGRSRSRLATYGVPMAWGRLVMGALARFGNPMIHEELLGTYQQRSPF
jgi:hypothetical protein